ncbi:MAG: VWA domain-containing protein, partial [Aquificota bacterium]|nr:VWA domain-containing protein [Aquificota bacterium]
MNWSAYNPRSDRRGWCFTRGGCGWTPSGNEEGYFIPDKVYTYNASQGYWEETNATPASCPGSLRDIDDMLRDGDPTNDAFWGWCLNFHLMSRMDLLRWATTGGRPAQCDYSDEFFHTDCDPDIVCTGNTCVLEAIGGLFSFDPVWDRSGGDLMITRILVPKERVRGILQELAEELSRPRIGVMFYSHGGPRGPKVYVGDYPAPTSEDTTDNSDPSLHAIPYTHVKRAINRVRPRGGTPTAVALWEAYDYFKQSDDHNYPNGFRIDPGTWRDPQYFCEGTNNNTCQPVPCAKNFVILASDGQWNIGGPPGSVGVTCTIYTGFE